MKKQAELFFPPEFADDFPVAMQISEKYGLVYVITKLGLLFVYDLATATAVYRNRISPDPIFLTANSPDSGGFYAINRCAAPVHCLSQAEGCPQSDCLVSHVSRCKCRICGPLHSFCCRACSYVQLPVQSSIQCNMHVPFTLPFQPCAAPTFKG